MKKSKINSLLFIFYLLPITISTISLNYSYLTLLFNKIDFRKKYDILTLMALIYFPLCCLAGVFVNLHNDVFLMQMFSFITQFGSFLIIFFSINKDKDEIKNYIAIMSFAYAFLAVIMLHINGFSVKDTYALKDALRGTIIADWPQGYPVLLIFGLMVFLEKFMSHKTIFSAAAIIVIFYILICTYTRSIWLATLFGIIMWQMRAKGMKFFMILAIIGLIIGAVGLYLYSADYFSMDDLDIYTNLFVRSYNAVTNINTPEAGSDSERLKIWSVAFNVIMKSPVFGTGYAGLANFTNLIGSSHSQIVDYTVRTGLVGLFFYIYLWFRLLWFYWRRDAVIFGAFSAILLFSFVNDTTRLTYISCIFFTFLNIAYSKQMRE